MTTQSQPKETLPCNKCLSYYLFSYQIIHIALFPKFSCIDMLHAQMNILILNAWDEKYIENEENDSETMHMLISLLAAPKTDPDWKLACNYMKLIAVTLSMKNIFITDNYEDMILA